MAVVCPDCCRVRSSAEAHGIVLSAIVLSLLCLLGGSVWCRWWCRRQRSEWIIGYVRCKSDARAKITSAVTNRLGGRFATQAMQSAAGKAFGF